MSARLRSSVEFVRRSSTARAVRGACPRRCAVCQEQERALTQQERCVGPRRSERALRKRGSTERPAPPDRLRSTAPCSARRASARDLHARAPKPQAPDPARRPKTKPKVTRQNANFGTRSEKT
eukprot:6211385-Pleurochrysis_carterae.AAC.6